MKEFDVMYYRLGLARAEYGDLTGAISFARFSLDINPENQRAKKLLEICLTEMGCPIASQTPQDEAEGLSETLKRLGSIITPPGRKNAFTGILRRLKTMSLINDIPDSNVRVLNIKACACAAAGNNRKAAAFFAAALERDKGNGLAAAGLRQVCK